MTAMAFCIGLDQKVYETAGSLEAQKIFAKELETGTSRGKETEFSKIGKKHTNFQLSLQQRLSLLALLCVHLTIGYAVSSRWTTISLQQ